jgi:hypothetical protein
MTTVLAIVLASVLLWLIRHVTNARVNNQNTQYHRGAQAAALDHLRFGSPAKKAPSHGRFGSGYAKYATSLAEVRAAAHKGALQDAQRLLREQQTAHLLVGPPGNAASPSRVGGRSAHAGAGTSGLPESISRQVDVDGGVEWPDWLYSEVSNLGYETLNRTRAEADRQQRLAGLFADASTSRVRRWMRYESPIEQESASLQVVHRVQSSTLQMLRRHATLVMVARGTAPLPLTTPVPEYPQALERTAAWMRVFGFFDATVVNDQVAEIIADGLVVSVVREPPGYRLTADNLNPLLATASEMDRLGVLVLIDGQELDALVTSRVDEYGLALFRLSLAGRLEPVNRAATALSSPDGSTDRIPWPHPSGLSGA